MLSPTSLVSRSPALVFGLLLLAGQHPASAADPNPKRGLAYIQSPDAINNIWAETGSPITWYYNYQANVSANFNNVSESAFEFVPMMWGAPNNNNFSDTSFLTQIQTMVKQGHKIHNVLGFNLPDLGFDKGGSNILPKDAAKHWINNMVPLQELGIRLGLPVIDYRQPLDNWTNPFLGNCSEMLQQQFCPFDFVPVRVFGNFSVLTDRIGMYMST
jgi:hypothetical protein